MFNKTIFGQNILNLQLYRNLHKNPFSMITIVHKYRE